MLQLPRELQCYDMSPAHLAYLDGNIALLPFFACNQELATA